MKVQNMTAIIVIIKPHRKVIFKDIYNQSMKVKNIPLINVIMKPKRKVFRYIYNQFIKVQNITLFKRKNIYISPYHIW